MGNRGASLFIVTVQTAGNLTRILGVKLACKLKSLSNSPPSELLLFIEERQEEDENIDSCCFGSVPYEEPWAFGDGFNGSGYLFAPCVYLIIRGEEKHMAGITEAGYIKDRDCTMDTPIFYGRPERPVYGQGVPIRPRVLGRTDTEHKRKIYLEQLFPLEDYDRIVVLLSGGKDSVACYCKLRELGVPKEKIEFWHHDIDGKHPSRRMDWRCTRNYVCALAEAEGVPLRVFWRKKGFFGELYRMGASEPVEWEEAGTGAIRQCRVSKSYALCEKIRQEAGENQEEQLRAFGCRMKFPMKTGDLGKRWCSAYLKIMVADTVMINLDRLRELVQPGQEEQAGGSQAVRKGGKQKQESRILVVSGERRGESAGRSKYNEMETHRTNAEKRARRIVHQWRPVIDYSEKDVWEVLKRHRITPHPCYRAGWNRCSCAMFLHTKAVCRNP